MSPLPIELAPHLEDRLRPAFDPEGKIGRALETLGPVADRDLVIVDGADNPVAASIAALGGRISFVAAESPQRLAGPDASVDAVVGLWSAFRGPAPAELAEVDRVLRPGGRHLVVHDYGRDDVSRLFPADRPEYRAWSQRDGPFLGRGFRVRVLHCWWTFSSLEEATSFLAEAFPEHGPEVAASLRRPRLAYNVAVYHRSRGDGTSRLDGAGARAA